MDYPPGSGRALCFNVHTDKPKKGFKILMKKFKERRKEIDEVIRNAEM
jgi:hypothetical protein